MKLKMRIKKYKNFIIGMLISMTVGGLIGGLSNNISKLNLSFSENINRLLFKAIFVVSLIIIIYLIITINYIRLNYMKVDLDNIPKKLMRKVSNATLVCTIQSILGLTWDAVVINKGFEDGSIYLIVFPTIFLIISGYLLSITMKYFNYLNPKKKMILYENGAEKKYFDKLDDGEKWVVYNCSYTTINKMQIVFSAALVMSMLLSMFISVSVAVPIVIGVIWIIQNLIYSLEARKYEED